MSFLPLFAHAAHWYMWILYAVPVLVVIAASVHALIDQRRQGREREGQKARGS
jgi:heme exporter protein D